MEPCLIQWLHVSHGAIWCIPHSPPWDWVGSGTQCRSRSCRASSGTSRLQVHSWLPLHFTRTPRWNDKKRIWELWNDEEKLSVWCPIQATDGLHEVTPGNLWPKERGCWSVGKTITLSQWQQTWRRNSEISIKRWNKERHVFDKVPQPKCINRYNEHMSGVDLHDLQVSRYHMSIRSKKWWWPIFAWSLNSALVNSHFFYRDLMGGTIDLLSFSRVSGTVSYAKVWHKTTEPRKEISTGC